MPLQVQIAALADASVQQLRDTLRRVNALRPAALRTPAQPAPAAVLPQAPDANADWPDTNFDVRQRHA